eukprot:SAG11_NODE_1147_length_5683_cov_40.952006_9_plen_137_part_00
MRDAERQMQNFEEKLALKNDSSEIMARMANDTATMEDFDALIDGEASAQLKQIEKVRAVFKQNIKAADIALAAADRKNATQAITVNLDGKVAISELLDSSALVLDVKSIGAGESRRTGVIVNNRLLISVQKYTECE